MNKIKQYILSLLFKLAAKKLKSNEDKLSKLSRDLDQAITNKNEKGI